MKEIFNIVKNNKLFENIEFSEFEKMFNYLDTREVFYKKQDIILLSGDAINFVGLILSGTVQIMKEDMNGNITIIAELNISELFGEVFACAGIDYSPVTVRAVEDCSILLFNYRKIITSSSKNSHFHSKLTENMLNIMANKTLMLNKKIEILSKRTTRDKLLCYFDLQRGAAKKFTLPFNREKLAQYICADRSAMSAELSRMTSDGIINIDRNEIEILY